jgi:hypothetical protein
MGRLLDLPTEIIHIITSHLPYRDKKSYRKTHKTAKVDFYPSYQRQNEALRLWKLIFKNDSWLQDVVSMGLVPVLIGHDLKHLAAASEGGLGDNHHYIHLTFVDLNPAEKRGRSNRLDAWNFISAGILSQLRSNNFNTRVREAQFPGFTLRVTTCYRADTVEDPYKILRPDGEQTTVLRFDGFTSTMYDTSDIELADDHLIVRHTDGTNILFKYY